MAREGRCPTADSDIRPAFTTTLTTLTPESALAGRQPKSTSTPSSFPTSDARPEHQDSCQPQGPDRTYPARGKEIDGTSGSEAHTRTHTMTKSEDTRMGV
ncbi:hypothetical protein RB213_011293 [Colletotrichum asianum]|uniref:Uncharacterized protein n=1 Tax=Colletotrichum asianum TaxID=702518 RepID=A0A8H3VYU5_9PEZI|nr:hypothetical protein GQ607_013747 [Colletotrichum asianum]